jgi:hypothetical protein
MRRLGVTVFVVRSQVPLQQEGEGHFEHETKPALSERLKAAANHVGEQLQDTVSSAWNHAWPNWKTVPDSAVCKDLDAGSSCRPDVNGGMVANSTFACSSQGCSCWLS